MLYVLQGGGVLYALKGGGVWGLYAFQEGRMVYVLQVWLYALHNGRGGGYALKEEAMCMGIACFLFFLFFFWVLHVSMAVG